MVTGTKVLLILGILLLAGSASATCSGSGLTWSCTAGSTVSQINTAINSASDGATITLANGSYSGGGISFNNRNGITLICATVGGCTFTSSGNIVTIDSCSAAKTNLVRVSGFVFSGTPSTGLIWYFCNQDITQIRIDHNSFTNFAGGQAIFFGETTGSGDGAVYGVVDHNTFTSTNNGMAMKNTAGGFTWVTGKRGTANNLFFEDNTVSFTNMTNLGLSGLDMWRASGNVVRHNTFTNTRVEEHSLCHGGPTNMEVYSNTINDVDGGQYRNLHSQGSGEITWFDNIIGSAGDGNAIALQHYRSDAGQMPQGDCTAGEIADGTFTAPSGVPQADGNRAGQFGYPAWHQPGRDANATLKPVYTWNNRTSGGTIVQVDIQSGTYVDLGTCANNNTNLINCHIRRDRDIYFSSSGAQTSATSPFNGTTGTGFGTLARRPTTCTPGPGGLDGTNGGVAYFATDDGSQGTLYRCPTTNTWVADYVPYIYPHPLQGGGSSAPAITFNPPTTLTFSTPITVGQSSSSQPVTVTNTGTATLTISSITDTGDFDQTNNCGATLAPSAFCTVNVVFTPTNQGTRTGTLVVTGNSIGTLNLSGTGVAPTIYRPTATTDQGQHAVSSPALAYDGNFSTSASASCAAVVNNATYDIIYRAFPAKIGSPQTVTLYAYNSAVSASSPTSDSASYSLDGGSTWNTIWQSPPLDHGPVADRVILPVTQDFSLVRVRFTGACGVVDGTIDANFTEVWIQTVEAQSQLVGSFVGTVQ